MGHEASRLFSGAPLTLPTSPSVHQARSSPNALITVFIILWIHLKFSLSQCNHIGINIFLIFLLPHSPLSLSLSLSFYKRHISMYIFSSLFIFSFHSPICLDISLSRSFLSTLHTCMVFHCMGRS